MIKHGTDRPKIPVDGHGLVPLFRQQMVLQFNRSRRHHARERLDFLFPQIGYERVIYKMAVHASCLRPYS
jgi:hypothetical protein